MDLKKVHKSEKQDIAAKHYVCGPYYIFFIFPIDSLAQLEFRSVSKQ